MPEQAKKPAGPGKAGAARKESEREEERVLEPSRLDDMTHAEMRVLYDEASDAVLFAKAQQWRTVGSTLVLYAVLIAIAQFVIRDAALLHGLRAIIIVATPAAVVILIFYQSWQYAEQRKLEAIARDFSSYFREVRAIKSRLEANIHRYVLLLFMVVIIGLGATVTFSTLLLVR